MAHLTVPGSRNHSRQHSVGHYQDADGDFGRQGSYASHAWSDRTGSRQQDADSNFGHREPIATHSRQLSHASDSVHEPSGFTLGNDLGTTRNALPRHGHAEPPVAQLLLKIIRAHDLRNADLGLLPGDVSDPFVVARLGSQEF